MDFRGDPRCGSSARGFIGFGEDGGVISCNERMVAKNKSSRSGKQLGGFVMSGLELGLSMNLG